MDLMICRAGIDLRFDFQTYPNYQKLSQISTELRQPRKIYVHNWALLKPGPGVLFPLLHHFVRHPPPHVDACAYMPWFHLCRAIPAPVARPRRRRRATHHHRTELRCKRGISLHKSLSIRGRAAELRGSFQTRVLTL